MSEIRQYEIWRLEDGSQGSEGGRENLFCIILSPNEMNASIETIIIAPMTRHSHGYPTRIPIRLNEEDWWVVLDQPSTIRKERLVRRQATLTVRDLRTVKAILLQMFVQ